VTVGSLGGNPLFADQTQHRMPKWLSSYAEETIHRFEKIV